MYLRQVKPPADYNAQYGFKGEMTARPAYNSTGREVSVRLNAFGVDQLPQMKIYQYDILIGGGAETRAVIRKVWNSTARKQELGQFFIFDGDKLGWSGQNFESKTIRVDLDAEQGRPPGGRPNVFTIAIRQTKSFDTSIVTAFLNGKTDASVVVAEAISFLDHLLREGPTRNPGLIPIRRQFFSRQGQRLTLGGGIEVIRGVYQSVRAASGGRCVINVDVANCCFWEPNSLSGAICARMKYHSPREIVARCRPVQDNGVARPSREQVVINKAFRKVIVKAVYAKNPHSDREWTIKEIGLQNAQQRTIDIKDRQNPDKPPRIITVERYFKEQYNLILQYPTLPVVEMTKKGVCYPMELLQLPANQRFPFKLDELQTANMIKFAVSRPQQRMQSINEGKTLLNWQQDAILNKYQLRVAPNLINTKARLLPPPEVHFAGSVAKPMYNGRWDLKAKRFWAPNPNELNFWGVGLFGSSDSNMLQKFVRDISAQYHSMGGRVSKRPPFIMPLNDDAAEGVQELYKGTQAYYKSKASPQLLVFLVKDRNSFHYLRIKKSCDCRFGVVSQVLQTNQVRKGNPQYYANVLMKVNAKLGGTTSQSKASTKQGQANTVFSVPTCIIGADVSHPSPGSEQPSMAAITVSMDRFGGRYAAACETNGIRTEMITLANWRDLLLPLMREWSSNVSGGRLPQHVYYFRDGVSEGQFIQVLNEEAKHIRGVMGTLAEGAEVKEWKGTLTVIVCAKRHHVRAFPDRDGADRNGNPQPGLLIERDVTDPRMFDFFLYSHIALQGTSRPVHYSVLYDSKGHTPNQLQNMIYEHCYQYIRSTTSVSLFPAVYYAHLASNRAKAHETKPASEGPQGGPGYKQNQPQDTSQPTEIEPPKLLSMPKQNRIQFSMWYI